MVGDSPWGRWIGLIASIGTGSQGVLAIAPEARTKEPPDFLAKRAQEHVWRPETEGARVMFKTATASDLVTLGHEDDR